MLKRVYIILPVLVLCALSAFSQSNDFKKVYGACLKAQSSMSDNEGSKSEIREALRMLTDADWSTLILQNEDVEDEASSMKGHMVFSASFFKEMSLGNNVFRKASEYAKEQTSAVRGSGVSLCTKCVKGNGKVTYKMNHRGRFLRVGAVAEVNGLINLSVVVKDSRDRLSPSYKVTSNEYQGARSRLLDEIRMPEDGGKCVVYITIENRTPSDRSVAIIVE